MSSLSAGPVPEAKPYKGPLSYEIEDAEYFFGRDRESDLLLARILSSRLTLLHAQSGAGKTSLLNARVLPGLEQHGWTAFRILPRGNPSDAVRSGVLFGLLPPPAAECAAVERALALFWEPGEDPSVGEMLRRFDEGTGKPEPRRRQALLPMESTVEVKPAALSFRGSVRPLFLRLLRATLEISQYSEHIKALLPEAPEIDEGMPASELRRILSAPAATSAYEQLLGDLYIPSPSLREFFANLLEHYGRLRTQFGLVLILDQFEELFTLFTDSFGAPGKQLWRLRWEFIDQIEGLYQAGAALPIRYVISMRDEYIAQLDSVRRFVRDLDASSYHLSFLEKEEAGLAIREPAKLFRYDYSKECYQSILEVLVREDRFVEPAPLQIVCERLWRERAKASRPLAEAGIREIPLASLPEGGPGRILDSFFIEVLESFGDLADRAEILEMLGLLVTTTGTRNIVARDALVKAPFRNAKRRLHLLNRLAMARIVRIEQRLGGQFVEISHEFLIASILTKIREVLDSDTEYGRFRWTIQTLESFKDIEFRADSSRLPGRQLFETLHDSRERINWEDGDWATELMLRSAVICNAPPDVLREWAERYRKTGYEPDAGVILNESRLRQRGLALLRLEELEIINAQDTSGLSARQIEFVLRSQIRRASDRNRPQIVRWTKELKNACDPETRY